MLDCPALSKNLLLRWLRLQKVTNVMTWDLSSVCNTNPLQEPELPQTYTLPLTHSATDVERAIRRRAVRSCPSPCSFECTEKRKRSFRTNLEEQRAKANERALVVRVVLWMAGPQKRHPGQQHIS